MSNTKPLTAKQAAFAAAVVAGMTQGDAYRHAYAASKMSEGSIKGAICELMQNPRITAEIEKMRAPVVEAARLSMKAILDHWAQIATADPNEVVRYRHLNCRHCHGVGHAYQWKSQLEWMDALAKASADNIKRAGEGGTPRKLPTFDGGDGFRFNREPNPHCPECLGEGIKDVWLADTAKVKGPARLLFKGIKMTRNGPEIQLHDQQQAMLNYAKAIGGMKEVVEHRGMVATATVELTEEQKARLDRTLNEEF